MKLQCNETKCSCLHCWTYRLSTRRKFRPEFEILLYIKQSINQSTWRTRCHQRCTAAQLDSIHLPRGTQAAVVALRFGSARSTAFVLVPKALSSFFFFFGTPSAHIVHIVMVDSAQWPLSTAAATMVACEAVGCS